ncbi:hypothetical protein [Flavobacterium sp. HTF]|uniref:hypothetical protein n=1 Tax=Flavobacterium sp. HTF TaxID=2170732 RepID=UPI000D5F054B|nr:hypothetical protein [Flavobacterium sp. HTF]PWB24671.1 hypothetical protein DCO46_11185 [Flavobacterium sp. HTF]
MKKLYKFDKDELWYAEYWISDLKKVIIHTGKVGTKGTTEELDFSNFDQNDKKLDDFFQDRFRKMGFNEFHSDNLYWLVVQYKMKSLKGNTRDYWLRDKATDYLNDELGWKGLGHVDGFDMGKTITDSKKFVLNIFCVVVNEELGINAIKRCLKEYRLDYTQIKIASRKYSFDGQYKLKYSAKKNDQTFNI